MRSGVVRGDIIQRHGDNTATFSPCERYRYSLTWGLDTWPDPRRGVCVFLMLNPSTADAFKLDPTLTRCKAFAEREGCGWLHVVNLFAFRATDPADMKRADDPVGRMNDHYIRTALESIQDCGGTLICGWGTHGAHNGRDAKVRKIITDMGVRPHCLSLTKAGHPGHPLYLRADSPVVPLPTHPTTGD